MKSELKGKKARKKLSEVPLSKQLRRNRIGM